VCVLLEEPADYPGLLEVVEMSGVSGVNPSVRVFGLLGSSCLMVSSWIGKNEIARVCRLNRGIVFVGGSRAI
jgi:hypothetical protein